MELVSDDPQKPQYALNLSETQNWSERMMAIELFAEVRSSAAPCSQGSFPRSRGFSRFSIIQGATGSLLNTC